MWQMCEKELVVLSKHQLDTHLYFMCVWSRPSSQHS